MFCYIKSSEGMTLFPATQVHSSALRRGRVVLISDISDIITWCVHVWNQINSLCFMHQLTQIIDMTYIDRSSDINRVVNNTTTPCRFLLHVLVSTIAEVAPHDSLVLSTWQKLSLPSRVRGAAGVYLAPGSVSAHPLPDTRPWHQPVKVSPL